MVRSGLCTCRGRGRCLCGEGGASRHDPPEGSYVSARSEPAGSGWESDGCGTGEDDGGGLLPMRVGRPLEK